MKVRTSELQGAALDWVVELIEQGERAKRLDYPSSYSTEWEYGGPIIERERIDVMWGGDRWCAYTMTPNGENQLQTEGPTPLIAAMRGYVASKLGFEVEIPEEVNV